MPGVTTAYQTGNHAGRPGNGAGCILYSCTTHGLVYRDDGTTWTTFLTLPSSATRASLGLDTTDSPQFAALNVGAATDTTLARVSAGVLSVEGNTIYAAGGTDVPIADGGTGASTKAAAFDALSPMTTAGDVIIGGASGTGTRLAAGTATHVLTSNGAGVAPSWQAGGGGGSSGALVLLEQHTASASATLDFTTCISATYDEYAIEVVGLKPATNAQACIFRVSTDGGSTYVAGAGTYSWASWGVQSGGAGAGGSGSDTSIQLRYSGASAGTRAPLSGTYRLYLVSGANTLIQGQGSAYDTANATLAFQVIAGEYLATTAVNAFRFLFASGNIASGTIRVYGIAK